MLVLCVELNHISHRNLLGDLKVENIFVVNLAKPSGEMLSLLGRSTPIGSMVDRYIERYLRGMVCQKYADSVRHKMREF